MKLAHLLALSTIILAVPFQAATAEPIKVGTILGLTGPADRWSKFQRMGIELAVDDLRAENIAVSLIIEDSRTEPPQSVSAFNKLIHVDNVRGVVGDIFSFLTLPLIPLADRNQKLLLSPSTPSLFCNETSGYFFSTASQVDRSGPAYQHFLDLHPEVRKLALVYFQDPGWGYNYRDTWRKLSQQRGIQIVSEFESPDFNQDFKAALVQILKQTPDAIFVAHHPQNFLRALRQLQYRGKLVFANNVLEIPAAKEPLDQVEGAYFVDTVAPQSFTDRFIKKFGEPPLLEPYNGYEALRVIVRALNASSEAPAKAIKSIAYDGVTGRIDFSRGCAGNHSDWHLKRFEAGRITVVQ